MSCTQQTTSLTRSSLTWHGLRRLAQLIGMDRTIAYVLLARGWSSVAGIVTVLLIAKLLSPVEQGYYYTFYSMAALRVFFELGFFFVVMQLAAHESAHLKIGADGSIRGDDVAHSRLASIVQGALRWYGIGAVAMASVLLTIGSTFFARHALAGALVNWRPAWITLVLSAALTLQLDPVCAFLEGCGFVANIARMRLWQAITGSLLAWTALLIGYGLFAPAMLIIGQALVQIVFLSLPPLRRVLGGLIKHPVGAHHLVWRVEVWPFQWRIALTWLSSYFTAQLITPALFAYQGAIVAGRMGMSMSISSAVGTIGLAWMGSKASSLGRYIAAGEMARLDALFFRTLWQSTAFVLGTCASVTAIDMVITYSYPRLGDRLLPAPTLSLVLLTVMLTHIVSSEALYLRVHKKEPMCVQSLVLAVLLAVATWVSAKSWGATGVAVAYFLFGGILSVVWATYTFVTKRAEWHAPSAPLQKASRRTALA